MIDVTLSDLMGVVARAEADDPEAALVAGRTLWDDMAGVPYARKLTLEFRVDGVRVYSASTVTDVVRSLQAVAS